MHNIVVQTYEHLDEICSDLHTQTANRPYVRADGRKEIYDWTRGTEREVNKTPRMDGRKDERIDERTDR